MEDKNKSNTTKGEFSYEDSESWSGNSESFSIKEIALRQFNRAMLEGTREMTTGGVRNRIIEGQVVEFIVPNQVQVFVSSVEMAFMPLKPYVAKCSDQSIKNKFIYYENDMKQLNKEYGEALANIRKEFEGKMGGAKDFSDEYNNRVRNVANNYENGKFRLSKQLLEAISYLLFDLDYFSETAVVGGAY